MSTLSNNRSKGNPGTPLILLGIVLALAVAIIMLYLGKNYVGGVGSQGTVPVVMITQQLSVGTILSNSQDSGQYVLISKVFQVEQVSANAAPHDAYQFTTETDLEKALDGHIVSFPMLANDILRSNDPHMSTVSGPAQSLANHNPSALLAGDVLFALPTSAMTSTIAVHEGDHIDVLSTACVNAATQKDSCQKTQTTLQDLLVYNTPSAGSVVVVVSHQDALALKSLVENTKLSIVLRKPGDDSTISTQSVDLNWIYAHFGF